MPVAMEELTKKQKKREGKKRKREVDATHDDEAEAAPNKKKNKKHLPKQMPGGHKLPPADATKSEVQGEDLSSKGTTSLRHKQRRERKKERRAAAAAAAQQEQVKRPGSSTATSTVDTNHTVSVSVQLESAEEQHRRAKKEAKLERLAKERRERQAKKEPKSDAKVKKSHGTPHVTTTERRAEKEKTRSFETTFLPEDKKGLMRIRDDQLAAWKASSKDGWTVSQPAAGRLIDCKPYLTADESRLVCATETALHVYTTSNSLLEFTLPSRNDGVVSCYTLSKVKSNVIFMATEAGRILTWDLRTGKLLGTWETKCQINDIVAAAELDPSRDTIYTISKTARWVISAHRIAAGDDLYQTEIQPLLKLDKPLQSLQVLRHGEIIVAISSDSMIVGKRVGSSPESLSNLRYAWREVSCAEAPICFEARVTENSPSQNKFTLDVAIGGVKGCIYVYQDVLVQLGFDKHTNTNLEQSSILATRSLHWHRESVETVAWSADGNYLISGGIETVLVLWQLDTGKKQFLPNLEAPIQSLTVSPSGASYVIRLGDNSVMVLSTSELMPTTNVASLQSWSLPTGVRFRPELPTMEMWSALNNASYSSPEVQAAINPRSPTELLAAVCSFQRDSNVVTKSPSAPYLQTFDIPRSRSIARQALTRTNATNLNMGPDGNRITEPDVKHLQISSDGLWLATVDEWSPNSEDVKDLAADLQEAEAAVDQQRTVQLRFWSWQEAGDEREAGWALNSRIDSPHMLDDSQTPGKVLHLVANTAGPGFASIGQDSRVKIWEPKIKLPNGKIARVKAHHDNPSNGNTSWAVRREVALEKGMSSEPFRRLLPSRAKLAFSQDGSTLAASQHFEASTQHRQSSMVHFINPDEDRVRQSRNDIFNESNGIQAIAFLGRHLICVGREEAVVWDVTTMESKARISLPQGKAPTLSTIAWPPPLLAINVTTSTFAIASPVSSASQVKQALSVAPLRAYTSKLELFSLADTNKSLSRPVWSATLPRLALSLLSAGGLEGESTAIRPGESKGYVLVDAGGAVRTIKPQSSIETGALAAGMVDAAEQPDEADAEMVDLQEQDGEESSAEEDPEDATEIESGPADRSVVRPEQLSRLLDHPAHAMPSMSELFDNILRLYAPKSAAVA